MSDTHLSEVRFDQLAIHPDVSKGIVDTSFEFCTPIQAQSLPVALQGKDISGQAQTGTGKTAAFLISCFHHLLNQEKKQADDKEGKKDNAIRSLILAPTRELAIQIYDDAKVLSKHTGLRLGIAYGGTDYEKQRQQFDNQVDILIGTPGRVIDYFKQKVFSLAQLEVIILDEADRMFDLGFIADIRYLFRNMPAPEERLNMLFSATLSHRVAELAYEHMNEPVEIKIETEMVTAERVEEIAYMPSNEQKIPLLLGILRKYRGEKAVVFINTKHMAEKLELWLSANDFKASLLSGDVPQKKRERLLNKFKQGETDILVATDVAARGLHIPSVGLVVNFDLPTDAQDYVHRIGRTARAGESGVAISLICETYAMNIIDIEEYIEHTIPVEREIDGLVLEGIKKPDFSKLKTDKKSAGTNERAGKDKHKGNRSDKRRDERLVKEGPRPKKVRTPGETAEAKDAAKRVALEKKLAAQDQKMHKRRTPLRGRGGSEVPAVG